MRRGPRYVVTRETAREVVARCNGNVSAAARELGCCWLSVRRAYDRPAWIDAQERRA